MTRFYRWAATWLLAGATVCLGADGRNEISQSQLPLTITNSGSYLVTDNLTGSSGQNGIVINADHVTLDLNGFALTGVAGSLDGLRVQGNRINLQVVNGIVRGWGADGIDLSTASNSTLHSLLVSGNSGNGVLVGEGASVSEVQAFNQGGAGITTAAAGTVQRCIARQNSGGGILVGDGCLVMDCVVRQNGLDGIKGGNACTISACTSRGNDDLGIVAGKGSQVTSCTGYDNDTGIRIAGSGGNIVNCAVYGNRNYGMELGEAGSAFQCTTTGNGLGGMLVSTSCFVMAVAAYDNGTNATSSGFVVTGPGNRLEENVSSLTPVGYRLLGASNLVVRNFGNNHSVTGFSILGVGNIVGPITTNPATTEAWANFSF